MFSEFVITDGANSIDLLSLNRNGYGAGITRYTPGRRTYKGGGVWQDSPLAPGRRLVHGVYGNINDALEIKLAHRSYEGIQQALDLLDGLLEKAGDYWTTEWQDEPVWIRARAPGERLSRYAIIHYAAYNEYPDPYHEPFAGSSGRYVLDGILLGIERSVWQNLPPGQSQAMPASNDDVPETEDRIYVVNQYKLNPLLAIYQDNGSLSGNLIDQARPYALFSSSAPGSTIYFGAEHRFAALLFDVGTPATWVIGQVLWEHSTGSGWQDISAGGSIDDGTRGFTLPGKNLVRFGIDPLEWQKDTIDSQELFWIRGRIQVTHSSGIPTQQGLQVYIPSVPYIGLASDATDIDSIDVAARVRTYINNVVQESATPFNVQIQEILIGSRTLDRGEEFIAYINPQAPNPTGVTVELGAGASILVDLDVGATIYDPIAWTPPDPGEFGEIVRLRFSPVVARQYYGRFRLFARIISLSADPDLLIRARVKFEQSTMFGVQNEDKAPGLPNTGRHLVDLGYVQIPPTSIVDAVENSDAVVIVIEARTFASLRITDFILLPADEWIVHFSGETPSDSGLRIADFDGAGYPKEGLRGILRDSSESITDTFQVIGSRRAILAANRDQRLWFVAQDATGRLAHLGIQVAAIQRYHYLRSG